MTLPGLDRHQRTIFVICQLKVQGGTTTYLGVVIFSFKLNMSFIKNSCMAAQVCCGPRDQKTNTEEMGFLRCLKVVPPLLSILVRDPMETKMQNLRQNKRGHSRYCSYCNYCCYSNSKSFLFRCSDLYWFCLHSLYRASAKEEVFRKETIRVYTS